MIATDPLSLVFVGCFLFGLLFLVIMALLGNIGHGNTVHTAHATHIAASHTQVHTALHASHIVQDARSAANSNPFSLFAYLNPTTVALFLFGFGFFGYVFHNIADLALSMTLILSGVCGLVIAIFLLLLLGRMFGDSEGATVQDVSDRTGLLGKVSTTIQPDSIGEIIYISPGGMRKSIPARSIDGRRLERDQEVVVVNYQHGVAQVDTWEHFVNQEDSGTIGTADADELATLRALLEKSDTADAEYILRKDSQKE